MKITIILLAIAVALLLSLTTIILAMRRKKIKEKEKLLDMIEESIANMRIKAILDYVEKGVRSVVSDEDIEQLRKNEKEYYAKYKEIRNSLKETEE